jgi:hypothetical protein
VQQYTEAELNPTLKPCPCCGGEPWFDKTDQRDHSLEFGGASRRYWGVRCRTCDLRTPMIANPKSPAAIWNKRPDLRNATEST